MIHLGGHGGSSSGHNNGANRPSNVPSNGQPFTLTRHKKVEIPATAILSHTQNGTRREPSDLGIPYPSSINLFLCFPFQNGYGHFLNLLNVFFFQ